ncbi:hypothetical protein SCIP_1373 [Scardovia inopinata JCM 12537]|nr:hypothetical protein SCIP_1373 [Scardovia inopinata JCM 12537]
MCWYKVREVSGFESSMLTYLSICFTAAEFLRMTIPFYQPDRNPAQSCSILPNKRLLTVLLLSAISQDSYLYLVSKFELVATFWYNEKSAKVRKEKGSLWMTTRSRSRARLII